MPYKEGALMQQIPPLVSARKNAVSGITAVIGVTLFVQEVQRIRELPFSLVNYEYLALLAVTGALVFLWIWGSEELEMLGRWLDPEEFPVPSSFNQLAMIMGLAFVLVCLFFAARAIRWYTSRFLHYVIVDFVMLRYVHGVIRHAVDGSYKRLRKIEALQPNSTPRQSNRSSITTLFDLTIFGALWSFSLWGSRAGWHSEGAMTTFSSS